MSETAEYHLVHVQHAGNKNTRLSFCLKRALTQLQIAGGNNLHLRKDSVSRLFTQSKKSTSIYSGRIRNLRFRMSKRGKALKGLYRIKRVFLSLRSGTRFMFPKNAYNRLQNNTSFTRHNQRNGKQLCHIQYLRANILNNPFHMV